MHWRVMPRSWLSAAVVAACLALSPEGAAAQTPAAWGAEADAVSRYLWRGMAYSDGLVLQPSLWITAGGYDVSIWSNVVVSDRLNPGTFDQVFMTASRTLAIGALQVEPTVQGYASKGEGGAGTVQTLEMAARMSASAGPLRVFTSHTVDIGSFAGAYVGDAGLSRSVALRPTVTLNAQASVGWASRTFNRAYVGVPARAVNYASLDGEAVIQLRAGWYLRPHLAVQCVIDPAVRRALGEAVMVAGGVAVGLGH